MDTLDSRLLSEDSLLGRLLGWLSYPRRVEDFLVPWLPLAETREVRARVLAVRPETPGCATLVLEPNAQWRGHRPGQWTALTIELNGVRRTRCFSIASAPSAQRNTIELTVKARPGGTVTPALLSQAIVGTIVSLSPAQGDFVLDTPTPERLLFVTGGSGITPVASMLRAMEEGTLPKQRVVLLHFARSLEDVLFLEELRSLSWLELHIVTEQELGCVPSLSEETLSQWIGEPSFENFDCYACGPAPLLDAVVQTFAARGARERVRLEQFSLPVSAESDATSEGGTVTFAQSKLRVAGKRSLLALAEEAGLRPASGCRIGICGTCRCTKLSGTTRDLRTGALSSDANVEVALCSTEAVGDVSLAL